MVWNAYTRAGWNPWLELSRMHSELDRLLEGEGRPAPGRGEFPPIEVWSGEAGLKLYAQLPGFEPEDIEASVVGDTLTLKGTRAEQAADGGTWHRQERAARHFVRSFQLPFAVEQDGVKASLRNGWLEVELPRAASEKPRRIAVEGNGQRGEGR
jgi:HSP20 family protein